VEGFTTPDAPRPKLVDRIFTKVSVPTFED